MKSATTPEQATPAFHPSTGGRQAINVWAAIVSFRDLGGQPPRSMRSSTRALLSRGNGVLAVVCSRAGQVSGVRNRGADRSPPGGEPRVTGRSVTHILDIENLGDQIAI